MIELNRFRGNVRSKVAQLQKTKFQKGYTNSKSLIYLKKKMNNKNEKENLRTIGNYSLVQKDELIIQHYLRVDYMKLNKSFQKYA